ncbi:hypothetical protein [Novosphingobium rosa]|uniref:hypothetical protein n=1 Tax=Novosphingobium rosa TaxID=76978 RepID=UPI0008368F32|nr:hypothetical protein [Novosphingobium rosa]
MNHAFLLAAALLGVSAPAMASPIVVSAQPLSFRGLEFNHAGQERVDYARAALHAAIPQGSALSNARALLTHAGARCTQHQADRMTCVANSFEAVDEMLHDVSWTIHVSHDGDAVTALSVERQSIGS